MQGLLEFSLRQIETAAEIGRVPALPSSWQELENPLRNIADRVLAVGNGATLPRGTHLRRQRQHHAYLEMEKTLETSGYIGLFRTDATAEELTRPTTR